MLQNFVTIPCIIILIVAYSSYFFIWKYLNSKPIETLLDLLIKEMIMTATILHTYFTVAIIIIPNLLQFQHEFAVSSGLIVMWFRIYLVLSVFLILILKQIMIYKVGLLDDIPDRLIILAFRIALVVSSTILAILDYYPLNYETTEDYLLLTGSKIPQGKYKINLIKCQYQYSHSKNSIYYPYLGGRTTDTNNKRWILISVIGLLFAALVWTQYKIYTDYNKAFIIEDINETELENQVCFMKHKEGMKTLIIIGIIAIIAIICYFSVLFLGLTHLFVIMNSLIIAILALNGIPLIYILRSPKIKTFIKKKYLKIRTGICTK